MAKKPQRSDFGRGLKGDRMYQNALAAYNRAASGKLSTAEKLFSMSEEAKAARRRAASKLDNRINKAVEGAVSKVKSDFSKFNTAANKAFSVKPQPSKSQSAKPKPKPDSTPVKPKPKPQPTPVKPKPKPQPTPVKPKPKPQPQPAAAKPKPKSQPSATLSAAEKKKRAEAAAKKKADAAAMKAELLKIRKAELAAERQKAYNKSMEQAKKNRARGQRRGGPRD